MLRVCISAALLLCLFTVSGCSSSLPSEQVTPPAPPAAKAQLAEVAASGELGSVASSIRESLESLKATDAATAEALLKELSDLEGLADPGKIKAKAKSMADKL
ncbi:MAG: hypothetical protein ACK524_08275 [Planctomyces sp.]